MNDDRVIGYRDSYIRDLKRWRNEHISLNFNKRRMQDDPEFQTTMRALFLADLLIERIRNAPKSKTPIDVVSDFYYEMDQVLGDSPDDHIITHRYAQMMEGLAWEILRRWRKGELPPW